MTVAFEPGDFVMKDAGVLLGEVVTVERRGDTTFVGLDIGWNVNCAYFIYKFAQEIVPVRAPLRERTRVVTVAGHINEASDVFAEDYPFPDVAEGEVVAILNAGGYLQAMSSTHCLRPTGTAVYLEREVTRMSRGEGWAEVAGGRLPYEVAGEGTGVVLAHAGIADMRQWDPQWEALTARHRVVRYDLRGFGRADVVETRFSNRADLVAVMDAAGLDRAVLVGLLAGGLDRHRHRARVPGPRVRPRLGLRRGQRHRRRGHARGASPSASARSCSTDAKDWEALAAFDVAMWVDGIGQPEGRAPAAARDAVRRMAYETYVQEKPYGDTDRARPARGRAPGRDPRADAGDRSAGWTRRRRVAPRTWSPRGVPGARRIDLPDVAHMPSLERPEWFTATLLEFLAEVDVAPLSRAAEVAPPGHALDRGSGSAGRSSSAWSRYCGCLSRRRATAAA